MTDGLDPLPGFLAAAFASAAATSLYLVLFEPMPAQNVIFAGIAFIAALFTAALHIAILAGPLYALLGRDRSPGPVAVLVSATLIGALPIPVFHGGSQDFVLFGAMGLVGGVAFLVVTQRLERAVEDE